MLQDLNNHFSLNISLEHKEMKVAGQYNNSVVYINSNMLVPFSKGIKPSRPNNFGVALFPNSLSLLSCGNLFNIALAHEYGHAIEDAFRNDADFKKAKEIAEDLAPKYLTVYAGNKNILSCYSEAFAEAFAVYMNAPEVLFSISTDLFHVMNDFYISFI